MHIDFKGSKILHLTNNTVLYLISGINRPTILYSLTYRYMSTRAIIHIFDKQDGFYIYLHWDSAPTRVSQAVDKAKKFSWEVSRFEACEFATALIKVLKDKAWWVYLSNTTEQFLM